MKDLYKRLGVPPTASAAEIGTAIAAADDREMREAAEFILLAPRRRAVYDRNHRVMTMIGQLRARLAMGLRPFWSHGNHLDFTFPFGTTGGRGVRDPMSVIGATGGHEHGRGRRRTHVWVAWGLVLVAVVLIALVVRGWMRGR
jgi:hypothetical protein